MKMSVTCLAKIRMLDLRFVKKFIVAGCVILYQLGFKVPVEKIRKLIAVLISGSMVSLY